MPVSIDRHLLRDKIMLIWLLIRFKGLRVMIHWTSSCTPSVFRLAQLLAIPPDGGLAVMQRSCGRRRGGGRGRQQPSTTCCTPSQTRRSTQSSSPCASRKRCAAWPRSSTTPTCPSTCKTCWASATPRCGCPVGCCAAPCEPHAHTPPSDSLHAAVWVRVTVVQACVQHCRSHVQRRGALRGSLHVGSREEGHRGKGASMG